MKILALSFDTPQENLAFEEFYFNHFEEDTLRIWRNPTSVVVGKHQNALAEVDLKFCIENNIPVLRRISGGGTVYHDLGNINFSFFRHVSKEKMIDYDRNLELVKEVLIKLGYPVYMSQRHDLFLFENKISGNAQHVKRGRSLHHGTILYDADLSALSKGIKRSSGTFTDKGVKSVRSPIANLKDYKNLGSVEQFEKTLVAGFSELGFSQTEKSTSDFFDSVQEVIPNYFTEQWNFGYSPAYQFEHEIEGLIVKLDVERGGKIRTIEVRNDNGRCSSIEAALTDKLHFYREIKSELENHLFEYSSEILLNLLF